MRIVSKSFRTAGRRRLLGLLAAPIVCGALAMAPAKAATYPDKPVKVVINFATGGPLDVIARLVAARLQTTLKQPFVVEAVTGASGTIGAGNVARAQPDGYTILFSLDTPFTVATLLYPDIAIKSEDLKAVSLMGVTTSTLVINSSMGVNSLKELVEKGKKEPLTFASAGNGSPGHLAAEMFAQASGVKINHIPYRGNAPAVTALVSGEVQAGILATGGIVPHMKANKIKGLATAATRPSLLLPDLPTTADAGLPGVSIETLFVAFVPAKTPEAIAKTLQDAIGEALTQPDIQERLRALDIAVLNQPGAAAAKKLTDERARYAQVIKAANIKAE